MPPTAIPADKPAASCLAAAWAARVVSIAGTPGVAAAAGGFFAAPFFFAPAAAVSPAAGVDFFPLAMGVAPHEGRTPPSHGGSGPAV